MNIFILDSDPKKAAQYCCDKHVVKMVLESAQILCAAHIPTGEYAGNDTPYKKTHVNHPCSVWARQTPHNYMWLLEHAKSLASEYSYRYGMNKRHKSEDVIDWAGDNWSKASYELGYWEGQTPFVQAMPEQYKDEDAVVAYRNYYLNEKKQFAKWQYSNTPYWWE